MLNIDFCKLLRICSSKVNSASFMRTFAIDLTLTFLASGWQLGSDPEIQVATVVSNHLTAGILKYFGEAGRYEQAVNLFEKLYAREPEVAALVAQAYIGMNEEIKAVQIMHHALKETPHSYSLLHIQCDFLRGKGKLEWASKLANESVNCAPTEFCTWAKLTECYVEREKWEEVSKTIKCIV